DLWDQFLPRVTAALPHTRDAVLREFKRKVKHAVTEDAEAANKANLFDAATAREILPWRSVHPACIHGPRRYGYMWLRDSFKAPHLLHARGVGHHVEDDCPHCNLQGALKPSHLRACPNLG